MSDRCVTLSDGRVIRDVDAILMGTGYTAPTHDPKLKLDDDRQYFMRVRYTAQSTHREQAGVRVAVP